MEVLPSLSSSQLGHLDYMPLLVWIGVLPSLISSLPASRDTLIPRTHPEAGSFRGVYNQTHSKLNINDYNAPAVGNGYYNRNARYSTVCRILPAMNFDIIFENLICRWKLVWIFQIIRQSYKNNEKSQCPRITLYDQMLLVLVVLKPSKRANMIENEKAVKSCCAHPDSHLLRQTDCVALYLGTSRPGPEPPPTISWDWFSAAWAVQDRQQPGNNRQVGHQASHQIFSVYSVSGRGWVGQVMVRTYLRSCLVTICLWLTRPSQVKLQLHKSAQNCRKVHTKVRTDCPLV